MFFGAAYYPEHRDPQKWAYDLEQMKQAHVNCLRVGEFAWSRFEPTENNYDFGWLDTFLDMAWESGIQLLICPPLRTLPAWMMEKDPSLAIIDYEGNRREYGSRYSFCINHPWLHEKGAQLAAEMAQHYGNHPGIAGWHLDNEHGDEPDCHCPICETKFRSWCEQRYDSIEKLNEAWGLAFWGLHFNHFEQIPTPRKSKTFHSPGHLLAWKRFRSESTINAVRVQADAIDPHIAESSFKTTNNQPCWNNRTDYFEMGKILDICGTNYYPPYGDNATAVAYGLAGARGYKRQNFQVHELRNSAHMIPGRPDNNTPAPGEVEKLTLHCVGNGADGIFYFRWRACPYGCEQSHGTITDFDGRPRAVYPEVQRVGKRLSALAPQLENTAVQSDIAILSDFPTRWVMETGVPWNGPSQLCVEQSKTIYNAIRELGHNCDITGREHEWSSFKVLVIPMLGPVDDELADKICRYVEQGGTLIMHPLSGTKTEEAHIHMDRIHPKLKQLIGVSLQEYITSYTPINFSWSGTTYEGHDFADLLVPESAQAKGSLIGDEVNDFYKGSPLVATQQHGEGETHYLATYANKQFYSDFLKDMFGRKDIQPLINVIPDGVEVIERSNPQTGERFTFLLNHRKKEQTVIWEGNWEDIYNQNSGSGEIVLPPHGVTLIKR